jgi:hypothetical protein
VGITRGHPAANGQRGEAIFEIYTGSNLTRIECTYRGDMKDFSVAAGISAGEQRPDVAADNAIAYWLQRICAARWAGVCSAGVKAGDAEADNHLLLTTTPRQVSRLHITPARSGIRMMR